MGNAVLKFWDKGCFKEEENLPPMQMDGNTPGAPLSQLDNCQMEVKTRFYKY